jgi:hypothetical protein
MKDVPMDKKKNLGKLPEEVRNKMGFKKAGGKVKMMKEGGSTSKRKVDPNVTSLQSDGKVTQAMKKAGKKAGKKDKSPKVFLGDPNRDGTIKKKAGGKVKKMMGGGMAMKYKHGGKVGKKCPRDGIAIKGRTKA